MLISTSQRVRTGADDASVGTTSILTIPSYLCVSYEKEQDVYQPARLLGVLVGALTLGAAKRLPSNEGFFKAVTGVAGLYLMGYNGARYLEVREEMARWEAEQAENDR